MSKTALNLSKINLTQNQEKVIKDKYLRSGESTEAWLNGVAFNIALAEILNSPKAKEWGAFEGVNYNELPAKGKLSKTLLFHKINDYEEKDANFSKLINNLEKIYENNSEAKQMVDFWAKEFYGLMSRFDFLPNSPTLMNAGRDLQQLSACYVLPVPDSIEGITKSLQAQSLIQKSGGGTGFSFGRLRAKGSIVKKTSGVASGALSFMQLFDKMTDVVKQGGTRRGANMGVLPYNHPEIEDFIHMKDANNCMENFNVSVAVDKNFFDAVKAKADFDLVNPYDGKPTGKLNAAKLFDTIAASAWKSGDPGVIYLDRMNEPGSNPTPALGLIESTNPCGEQPLLPWEPCNLGSINLAHFVTGETTKGKMDYTALGKTVSACVRFLDNVIDINNYPLPEIEKMAKTNRRIGLGIMGLSEAFVKMGIAYDSQAGLAAAQEIMKFINDKALEASEALAKERGVFPNFKDSVYDEKGKFFAGKAAAPRHAARTTIAPTGTIAITAGLQGSGIEPFFAIAYTRYNAQALEALKNGQTPKADDVFFEVNPLFKEIAEQNNYFGLSQKDLWAKIDKNHKAVRGIKEIPQHIQDIFPTAHDVSIENHIKMQAAFQRHIDNAVSKTINMNNNATIDDIKKAYLLSYEMDCKGITIYRDGCKTQQVLNTTAITQKPKEIEPTKRAKPFGVSSHYYEVQTGYGPLHVHINYDELGPYQVFSSIAPIGTEISGLTSLVGILISKYLELGGEPVALLKHLNSIKGDRPIGFGANHVNSIAHGIAIALKSHMTAAGADKEKLENDDKLTLWDASKAQYCPKCYSSNISFEGGCSGPTCHDCGYSKCS
ncbi:MAG: adenosylcobalamin-dependent ribonucleoside-diphosphate reductase [Elusimicrobiota bacterium]|jgi:ribonucleoside-diphosphate reductase alpha chain|nr:adenosylcobalamin-dependent ribonucleoside-diphosphate reductase [Elusimicrobiota bacterium]